MDDLLARPVPRRGGLIAKGMILSPAHGDTAITVPLFDELLRPELSDRRPAKDQRGDDA